MKIVGFIIIMILVAAATILLYVTVHNDATIVSPVPERSGIKVIEASPSVK